MGRAIRALGVVCLLLAPSLGLGDTPEGGRPQAELIAAQGREIESQARELRLLRDQISGLQSAITKLMTRVEATHPANVAEADSSHEPSAKPAPPRKTQTASSPPPGDSSPSPSRQQNRAASPEASGAGSPRQAQNSPPTESRRPAPDSSNGSRDSSRSSSRQASAGQSEADESRPDSREESEEERRAQLTEAIPVRSGGVLLPPGRLVLEPQIRYGFSSVNRVEITGYTILPALTLGIIDVTRRDSSTITSLLTARYGLSNRFEVDFSAPYVVAWSRFRLSDKNTDANRDQNLTADGRGIGDIRFGIRTQLNRGTKSVASFVAGVGVRIPTGSSPYEVKRGDKLNNYLEEESPTGSGFYSLSPTVSFVYPAEPGVIFGSFHYSWNIARTINAIQPSSESDQPYGRIDPGDVIGASLGMGLSLNEKLSVSLTYDHSVVTKTKQNGITPEDAVPLQIGTLGFGATMRRSSRISYSFMVGVGVTDDAPDVSLTFRIPTTLDLKGN